MVGWPWLAPLHNTHRLVHAACVPSSFRGVTTFSLPLNCFAPSSLISQSLPASPQTPSRSAWLQATQLNKRPAAHAAEVEGPSIDPASSFIRRVIGEMDVEGGGRPAVQLQSTTKRAASSPWVRKLSFVRFLRFDSKNLSLCVRWCLK
jgi:hypothetical protein